MFLLKRAVNGKMIALGVTKDEQKPKWYFMNPQVQAFVNHSEGELKTYTNFKIGDEVTITTEDKNGSLYITKIEKGNVPQVQAPTQAPAEKTEGGGASAPQQTTWKATCSKCKKECEVPFKPSSDKGILCKECYAAQQGHGGGSKTPAEQNTIKRQAIGHMTSRSLASLHGNLTIDNVEGVIRKLYALYTELVG